jgi:hypothetical protein
MEKTLEQCGRPQKASTRKKIAKALMGKKNPAWKDGRHPDHYRRVAGAKKGDGSIIHHKDGNRHNSSKSNLQKVSAKDRGKHDKIHNRANNFKKKGSRGTSNPMKSKSGISTKKKK